MKHVREELPDVQLRRPGGLQRAGRRARPRDGEGPRRALRRRRGADRRPRGRPRHRDRARGPGHRRGDHGPAHAAARAPSAACRCACAHPARAARRCVAARRVAAAVALRPARRPHRARHRHAATSRPPPGLKAVSLGQSRRQRLRPARRRRPSTPTEAKAVVDRDPSSTWSTETLHAAATCSKDGVGIYVDAEPGVAARAIEVRHADAGLARRDLRRAERRRRRRRSTAGRRLAPIDARPSAARASTSTRPASATATTSSGSRSCRRRRASAIGEISELFRCTRLRRAQKRYARSSRVALDRQRARGGRRARG